METLHALLAAALILGGGIPVAAPSLSMVVQEVQTSPKTTEQILPPVPEEASSGETPPAQNPAPVIRSPECSAPISPPRLLQRQGPLWNQGVMIDPDLRTWSGEDPFEGLGLL
jgi:hypothetical protein